MMQANEARETIRRLLRRCVVADIERLYCAVETRSRMTIFRRLTEIGYTTSYTHAGSYYTLVEIPQYDSLGLWFYRDIGFSRARTLGDTIVSLVDSSPQGFTYSELRAALRTRVENALARLVRSGRIVRSQTGRRPLYVSVDGVRAGGQIAGREIRTTDEDARRLSADLKVEVLVEVIRTGGLVVPPEDAVARRLQMRGLTVDAALVASVYAMYGLEAGKKTMVPHLRRSRG